MKVFVKVMVNFKLVDLNNIKISHNGRTMNVIKKSIIIKDLHLILMGCK